MAAEWAKSIFSRENLLNHLPSFADQCSDTDPARRSVVAELPCNTICSTMMPNPPHSEWQESEVTYDRSERDAFESEQDTRREMFLWDENAMDIWPEFFKKLISSTKGLTEKKLRDLLTRNALSFVLVELDDDGTAEPKAAASIKSHGEELPAGVLGLELEIELQYSQDYPEEKVWSTIFLSAAGYLAAEMVKAELLSPDNKDDLMTVPALDVTFSAARADWDRFACGAWQAFTFIAGGQALADEFEFMDEQKREPISLKANYAGQWLPEDRIYLENMSGYGVARFLALFIGKAYYSIPESEIERERIYKVTYWPHGPRQSRIQVSYAEGYGMPISEYSIGKMSIAGYKARFPDDDDEFCEMTFYQRKGPSDKLRRTKLKQEKGGDSYWRERGDGTQFPAGYRCWRLAE